MLSFKVLFLVVAAAIAGAKSKETDESLQIFIREVGKVLAEEIRKVDPAVLTKAGQQVATITVDTGSHFVEENPQVLGDLAEISSEVATEVSQGAQTLVSQNPKLQALIAKNPLLSVLGSRVVNAIAHADPKVAKETIENAANMVDLEKLVPAGQSVLAEAISVGSDVVADNADLIVEFIAQLVARDDVKETGGKIIQIVLDNSDTIGPITQDIVKTALDHIKKIMEENPPFATFVQKIVVTGTESGSRLLKTKPALQKQVLGFLGQNPGILTAILEVSAVAADE